MFDPGLHQIGIMQCEANAHRLDKINFKVVFVSPLQRTLQTCIHLFKKNPRKGEIRFVVLPIIREVLETSNDIALDVNTLMEMYAPDKDLCGGLNFDFSLMMLYGLP